MSISAHLNFFCLIIPSNDFAYMFIASLQCILYTMIMYSYLKMHFFVPSSLGLLCYSSGCLVVMDSLTSGKQWQLVGHPTEVSTIALQQDGCGLASASPAHSEWSCEVRVWSLETKKCIEVRILASIFFQRL